MKARFFHTIVPGVVIPLCLLSMKCRQILSISLLMLCLAASSEGQDSSVLRSVPDSVALRLQNDKDFLYANDPSAWEVNQQDNDPAFLKWLMAVVQSPLLRIFFYLLIAIVLIFVIYQVLIVNNLFIFSRSGKRTTAKNEDEEISDTQDLDALINAAVTDQNYRQAIRYLYLKTLRSLQEKNLIKLHAKATNQEYIKQMQRSQGSKEFNLLTRVYEYVWYGGYEPEREQYDTISRNFNDFISKG